MLVLSVMSSAEAVMTYLKSRDVRENQITARRFGEDPKFFANDNKTPEGRRENRRTEIEAVK